MQWFPHTSLFSAPSVNPSFGLKRSVRAGLLGLALLGVSQAQDPAAAEAPQKDAFDYEADFIGYLLDEGLFDYAALAVEEARSSFPDLSDRIQVVEVSTLLRQGKTAEVEKILEGKNLARDMKSQAMLLQLAMTYDAMGNSDAAMTKYQEFLKLNENKEISDPDVLRYFASAALRLSLILKEESKFEEAAKVLDLVIKTSEDDYLKRKFQLMAAQNRLDQGLTLNGNARKEALKKSEEYANDLLYGGNDNFFYMAMGIKAWMHLADNKPEEAVSSLRGVKKQAVQMEKTLDDSGVPKSEYPRAIMRYVEGLAQWELAKKAAQNGDMESVKKLAAQSAGNLYNAFLRYEGNEYGDRAALAFEDLKVWIKDTTGKELKQSDPPPRVKELMFKRELDLAAKLFREGEAENAEGKLINGLLTYPETKYTLNAYDTLSRIWISEDADWELMALTAQTADRFPDVESASRIMLRVGKKMADDENLVGVEKVLGDFGRNYPSHPSAPGMLYRIGNAAAERGDNQMALDVYGDILELYPQSDFAIRVLQLRAEEALRSENYEEAIKAYEQVRDQSRDPMQAAFAKLRIADSKLNSEEPDLEKQAVSELQALRKELENPDSVFAEADNREQTQDFLQNVRYRSGQVLLRQSSQQDSDELRAQAAKELNSFLEEFPDTKQAPDVMYNLGRLYLQQGQFEDATRTFEQLNRKYPDSEAGKDALYSLVKAALEEGQVEVAQQAVQKMVAQPEAYEIEKIYKVAQLMLENERWVEARDSYQLVLESDRIKNDESMRQRVLYGLGEAAMGAGEQDAAVESFQMLIKEFPTSRLVMDAGVSLSEIHLKQEPPNVAKAKEALGEVARILRSITSKEGKAKLNIALGNVSMAEGKPGAALASWYSVGLGDADAGELGALVREAITLALAEAQTQIDAGNENRWNLVIELTDQYIKNFPMDKQTDEMRSLNSRAISLAPREN